MNYAFAVIKTNKRSLDFLIFENALFFYFGLVKLPIFFGILTLS